MASRGDPHPDHAGGVTQHAYRGVERRVAGAQRALWQLGAGGETQHVIRVAVYPDARAPVVGDRDPHDAPLHEALIDDAVPLTGVEIGIGGESLEQCHAPTVAGIRHHRNHDEIS